LSKKTIIRNPNDKSPFTKLEIHILKTMYKALNGASWDKSGYNDFGKLKKIKEIYGFTNIETMYIGSLYKKNYVADGDFDSILPPKIPEMRMYNVSFFQDVSAYRDIHFNIIAGDEDMAIEGSSYDFDYRTESFSEEEWDDPIEIGDYNDVYNTDVEEDPDSLGPLFATPQKNIPNIRLENRNNIKKILKEREESLFNSPKMNKNLDRIINRLVDETHYNGIDFTYSWFNLPPPHVPPLNLSSRHYNSFLSHLKDLYGIKDEGEMQFIWRNYYRRLLMKYRQ